MIHIPFRIFSAVLVSRLLALAVCTGVWLGICSFDLEAMAQESASSQPAPKSTSARVNKPARSGLHPFGSSLFEGNFLHAREDGVNANYVIMPGDHVAVYSWGAVDINQTFVVDSQGNIFLPEIGPIHLAGVKNGNLTQAVEKGVRRVYTRYLSIYTNLLSAKPVGVFVTGGVRRPGRYAGVPSDSVLFYLDQAGGVDPDLGSYRSIEILRDGLSIGTLDLYQFLLAGELLTHQFQEGDIVLVKQRGPVIELRGDVAADRLLEFGTEKFVGETALNVVPGSAGATGAIVSGLRNGLPFKLTLPLATFRKFELRNGDKVVLKANLPSNTILVNVEGETQGASTISVQRGSRLIDVLNYIAVNRDLANVNAIHLRRGSVARAQKDSIEDSLFRLERSALLALSSSTGESAIRVKEAELTRQFVERARLIQPLGRVVTSSDGVQQNIRLEAGDTIVIPPLTQVIRVGGEVLMAQAVMYQEGLIAEDYIGKSGGYTDRAESDRVIILRANAEVVMGNLDSAILPGDEILVPPRVDTKALQNIVDVTQIMYQIAVAAAVVLRL